MTLETDQKHVTVRMYNVGFGDCFLIVFPAKDRPRKVLVDCGSHFQGHGPRPMKDVVKQIVEDVTDADGVPRIDLVVGTHRHQDHVSGFDDRAWQTVEVGEVWMPWIEHPTDPEARRIRERQSGLALALTAALDSDPEHALAHTLALNALTNEKAMTTLHRGFAGTPERKFLPTDRDAVLTKVEAEPLKDTDIEVMVLGPSHDEAVIRDMDPPKGAGYLRLAEAAADGGGVPSPFDDSWAIESRALAEDPLLKPLLLSGVEASQVKKAAESSPFEMAVALESAVNNTSLVLAFRLGSATLLFSGDAQWGTWKRILDSPEAMELVEQTRFLKVGHHGSHNATPKALIERLAARDADVDPHGSDLWAMVSTRKMDRWKFIPKQELMTAIGEVTPQVARSDAGTQQQSPGFEHWSQDFIDAKVPLQA